VEGERRERGKGEKKGRGREREGPVPSHKFLDPPMTNAVYVFL